MLQLLVHMINTRVVFLVDDLATSESKKKCKDMHLLQQVSQDSDPYDKPTLCDGIPEHIHESSITSSMHSDKTAYRMHWLPTSIHKTFQLKLP